MEKCECGRILRSSYVRDVWITKQNGENAIWTVPIDLYKKMVKIAEEGNCELNVNGQLVEKRDKHNGQAI